MRDRRSIREQNDPDAMACRALTRRDFVAGSLTIGAVSSCASAAALAQAVPLHCAPPTPVTVPTPFVPEISQPVRVRKSVFELNAQEISRLKAAYAALRRLYEEHPEDARGWYYQGLVHCWYCSGALNAIVGPEIHNGWYFLPWHRAYLHLHERILAALINDPTFSLPYWDWDTPDRNQFPPPYMDPADQTNPLFDPFRAIDASTRIPDNLTGPDVIKNVLGQATFGLFAGVGQGASGQRGAIERAPHGGVHLWVANPATLLPPQVNMGVLGTAAFDPVFFSHHANIDRLWTVWLNTTADPPHANPSEEAWLLQDFVFYDQRRQWTQILVDQVVDSEATLRYRYQPPSAQPAVAAAPAAAPAPPPRAAPARLASTMALEIATSPGGTALTPDPHTFRVAAPPAVQDRLRTLAATPQRRVILHIDGIQVPSDRGALVNVFLNRPDATAATPVSDPGFVGAIVEVPNTVTSAHGHQTTLSNVAFDITAKIASVPPPAGGELTVTLVPFQGGGARPAEISLRYRRIYIAAE